MRIILTIAVLTAFLAGYGSNAHADEVYDPGRVVRALNGSPENPAAPMRTKTGTDGRLMGEYPKSSGAAVWRDVGRQPWFVMPLRDSLKYYTRDGGTGTAVFSRASAGYYRDSAGAWTSAGSNEPRFGFANLSSVDGWRWDGPRYMGEDSCTNYVLDSGVPATQTVTLGTTGYYTLWVEGAGSCAIAANTAAGTGFGTATEGSHITVNIATGGTVDLTVSGSLTRFQLENKDHPTSYILTTVAAATRAKDTLSFPKAGLFADTAGSVAVDYVPAATGVSAAGYSKWYLLLDGGSGSGYPLAIRSIDAKIKLSDGTTTPAANFTRSKKVFTFASSWGDGLIRVYNKTESASASGAYDGSFGMGASLEVGRPSGIDGFMSNLRLWHKVRLKDSEVDAL